MSLEEYFEHTKYAKQAFNTYQKNTTQHLYIHLEKIKLHYMNNVHTCPHMSTHYI